MRRRTISSPLGACVTGSQYMVDGGTARVSTTRISDAVEKALFVQG